MAQNKIQKGNRMTITPSGGADSEDLVRVNGQPVVAAVDIASGESGAAETKGVWELAKDTGVTILQGQLAYLSASTGKVTNVAASNYLIGVFWAAAASAATTANVLIGLRPMNASDILLADALAQTDSENVEDVVAEILAHTAADVPVTDAGGLFAGADVEAVLAEIGAHLLSAQAFLPLMLAMFMETDGTNVVGFLGAATTPVLDLANGDTDSGLIMTWAATNVDPVLAQIALPPDMDRTADLIIHFRAKMDGATDTPVVSCDAYFDEGDTKIEDDSAALSNAYQELTITIAAADVPAAAQSLSFELTPGTHANDAVIMSASWLEYTRKLLAA